MGTMRTTVSAKLEKNDRSSGVLPRRFLCLSVVIILSIPGYLPLLPGNMTSAQVDPPPFGDGDWIIDSDTIIKDASINIEGNLTIQSGSTLTLDHTILLVHMNYPYTYNILVQGGGKLIIKNDSFVGASDERYALWGAPGSSLRISNSTISGLGAVPVSNKDTIIEDSTFLTVNEGIVLMDATVWVKRTTFSDAYFGIWSSMGTLYVDDSYFIDDLTGIRQWALCNDVGSLEWPEWTPSWINRGDLTPCGRVRFAYINNSIFLNSIGSGIWANTAELHIRQNEFRWSGSSAIDVADDSDVYIEDNLIDRADKGIVAIEDTYDGIGSRYYITNNIITNCSNSALYVPNTGFVTGVWTVDKTSYVDSMINSRFPIEVKDGGTMTIEDTSVRFYPTGANDLGFNVESGGTLNLDGVTVRTIDPNAGNYFFNSEDGSNVTIAGSNITHVGIGTGGNSAFYGLLSGGTTTIKDSFINDSVTGVTAFSGKVSMYNSRVDLVTDAVHANGGDIELYDSILSNVNGLDVKVESMGRADLYNVSFTKSHYMVDSGVMNVYWDCDIQTMWENGATIPGVAYNITEPLGPVVASGLTGLNGLSEVFSLREFTDKGSGKELTTPHSVTGKFLGMTNNTEVSINGNSRINLTFFDGNSPLLNVTSPGLDIHQKNGSLVINGTASDKESGLDRVQWSLDMDLWSDADGLDTWGFETVIPFGSYEIYIRAIDRAGNVGNLTIHVQIDKDPPFLYILSPNDGFITKLSTVLVEGATEYGAKVTIKGVSIIATDGSFRLAVPIDEGENRLLVTALDETGNTNSTNVTVYRDTTAPVIVVTNPPNDYITNRNDEKNMLVTGYTEPNAKLMVQGRFIPLSANGSFSFTYGLDEGLNELDFLAEDTMGNQNSTVLRIIFDQTPPTMVITSPKDGLAINNTVITVKGLAEPGSNITARTQNSTASTKTDPTGLFQVTIDLSEGPNLITVTAKDKAGNTKSGTVNVIRDTVAPEIELNNIKDKMVTDQASIIVEGQTEVGARVKVNGDIIQVGRTGKFGVTLNLFSLNNTFVFESTDKAGNTKVLSILIKRKAPPEPKPTGTGAVIDYLPIIAALAIIILVVQWAVIARHGQLKARKKFMDETTSTVGGSNDGKDNGPDDEMNDTRKSPRRPKLDNTVVTEGADQEFEIEYGNGSNSGPGGGRR